MSEIKQNITNELSEEELENVAGGFGRPNMEEIQKALKSYS